MAKAPAAPQTDFDDELEQQTRPAAQEPAPVAGDLYYYIHDRQDAYL